MSLEKKEITENQPGGENPWWFKNMGKLALAGIASIGVVAGGAALARHDNAKVPEPTWEQVLQAPEGASFFAGTAPSEVLSNPNGVMVERATVRLGGCRTADGSTDPTRPAAIYLLRNDNGSGDTFTPFSVYPEHMRSLQKMRSKYEQAVQKNGGIGSDVLPLTSSGLKSVYAEVAKIQCPSGSTAISPSIRSREVVVDDDVHVANTGSNDSFGLSIGGHEVISTSSDDWATFVGSAGLVAIALMAGAGIYRRISS